MKNLILVTTIILLAASCKKEVQNKTCTFNDEVVDCATLNPSSNPSSASSLDVAAVSEVTINYEDQRFEIHDNITEFTEDASGNNCSLDISAMTIQFELSEDQNSMRIFNGDETENYSRIENGIGLEGKWKLDGADSKYSYSFEFLNNGKMKFFLTCHF